jgi:hypothetical protein
MNKFSNMLKIPPTFDLYREMVNKIATKLKTIESSSDVPMFGAYERKLEDLMIVENPTEFKVKPIKIESSYPIKSINDLTDSDEKFVLHLNVLKINPQSVYDSVLLLCSNCRMR